MPSTQIQNVFSLGELDPVLLGRIDYQGYYKSARKLRNCLVIPQGGVKQRFGTFYINYVEDDITGTVINDETQVMFLVFSYDEFESYLIVVRPDNVSNPIVGSDPVAIDIYLNEIIVATLRAADGVPWTVADVDDLRYVRATDRVLMLHEDYRPQQLIRGATSANWTITPQPFLFYPVYDFSNLDGVSYTGPTFTFTPSGKSGAINLTASAAIFTSNHVGGLYIGGGGIMRLDQVVSNVLAAGFTIDDFTAAAAIRGDQSLLLEPAWGDGGGAIPGPARGWPGVGAIFQNRLIYGRTPILKNFLAASTSFDFNNFDTSEGLDAKGFTYSLGSDSLNKILNMVSSSTLTVLTTNSTFSSNAFLNEAITPSNVYFNEQSREGCNEVLAQVVDDQILYADHNNNTIKSIEFDIIQSRFQTSDASLLSPHLIRGPREAAFMSNPNKSEGNYYVVVNYDDYSLAVYQTLKDQSISAWTLSTTQGEFLDICANRDDAYVIVRRQSKNAILGGTNKAVLKANPGFNTFIDISSEAATVGLDVDLFDGLETPDSYLLIGNYSPFDTVGFMFTTLANTSIIPEFEYLNKNNRWVTLPNVVDGTIGMTANGSWMWDLEDLVDWAPQTVDETERMFWMRCKRTVGVLTTLPVESQITNELAEYLFIERLAFDYITDFSVGVSSDGFGIISVPQIYENMQVWALQQTSKTYNVNAGIPHGPYIVEAGGFIEAGEDLANKEFVIGIEAPPEIVPLPPVAQFEYGPNVYFPRLIQSMFVDYYESAGLIVANREIPVLKVGGPAIDIPLNLKTGFWEITPFQGRNPRVEIPITTTAPFPFTVIAIGYKVEV